MSDWLVVAIVFLVVVLAVWQTYQLQQIRKQVDAVPKDGNVFTLIDSTSGRLGRDDPAGDDQRRPGGHHGTD